MIAVLVTHKDLTHWCLNNEIDIEEKIQKMKMKMHNHYQYIIPINTNINILYELLSIYYINHYQYLIVILVTHEDLTHWCLNNEIETVKLTLKKIVKFSSIEFHKHFVVKLFKYYNLLL